MQKQTKVISEFTVCIRLEFLFNRLKSKTSYIVEDCWEGAYAMRAVDNIILVRSQQR